GFKSMAFTATDGASARREGRGRNHSRITTLKTRGVRRDRSASGKLLALIVDPADTVAMSSHAAKKSALVLSGGGAYGAYEIGVIRALFEGRCPSTSGTPLDPDIYSGTSVGNYNAAFLAMNEGGALEANKRLRAVWTDRVADNGDGRGNGVYRIRGNPFDYTDLRAPGSPLEQLQRLLVDTASLGRAAAPRVLNLFSHERLLERMKELVNISAFLNVEPFRH